MNRINNRLKLYKTQLNNQKAQAHALPPLKPSKTQNKLNSKQAPFLVSYYPKRRRHKSIKAKSLNAAPKFIEVLRRNKQRHRHRNQKILLYQSQFANQAHRLDALDCRAPLAPVQPQKAPKLTGSVQRLDRLFSPQKPREFLQIAPTRRIKNCTSFNQAEQKEAQQGSGRQIKIILPTPSIEQSMAGESNVKRELVDEERNVQ